MQSRKLLSIAEIKELQNRIDLIASYEQSAVIELCTDLECIIAEKLISEDEPIFINILFTLAKQFGISHKIEKSFHYISLTEQWAVEHNDHLTALKARMNKAIMMVESGGIHDAIDVWTQLVNEVDNKQLLPNLYNNLGKAYNMCDQHEKALDYLYRAIEVLENTDRLDDLGNIYNNIAGEYRLMDNFEKALEYYTLALDLSMKVGNHQRIAMVNNNLCLVYTDMKELDQAYKYGMISFECGVRFCPENEWPHIYNNLGLIHMYKDRFEEAGNCFNTAITIAKKYNESKFVAIGLNNLAKMALLTQDYDLAIQKAEESLFESIDSVNSKHASVSYDLLRQAYFVKRQYKKAYTAFLKYHEIEHNLNIENPKMILARAESAYLGRKVEVQAETYRLQNIELNKSNQIITEKTRELELSNRKLGSTNNLMSKLVSIIAHDVRGPVSSIAQILGVFNTINANTEHKETLIGELHKSATATLVLLEDLLLLIRNYNPEFMPEVLEIDIVPIVAEILSMYKTLTHQKNLNISFEHSYPNHMLNINADHLKVIIRNIIANAIKFTPEKGSVSISIGQDSVYHIITVLDTGIGMDQAMVDSIIAGSGKSTLGTADEKGFGMGLKFALEFLRFTEGKLEISSEPWKGSTFRIYYKRSL